MKLSGICFGYEITKKKTETSNIRIDEGLSSHWALTDTDCSVQVENYGWCCFC